MEGIDKFGRAQSFQEAVRGPPGPGFVLTENLDYSLENKRLVNVATPIDANDAVTRHWTETKIDKEFGPKVTSLETSVTGLKVKFDTVDTAVHALKTKTDNIAKDLSDGLTSAVRRSDLDVQKANLEKQIADERERARTELHTELKKLIAAVYPLEEPTDLETAKRWKEAIKNTSKTWHDLFESKFKNYNNNINKRGG